MSQPLDNIHELYPGVSETVAATAERLRVLTDAAMLEESLSVPETSQNNVVSFDALKQQRTEREAKEQAAAMPAGRSVTALSEAMRAVDEAFRSAA